MSNQVCIAGTPVVAAASGQIVKGPCNLVGFIPAVTGTLALWDTANNDSTGAVMAATTVTAGVYLPLNMAFNKGVQAGLTTATGTFLVA